MLIFGFSFPLFGVVRGITAAFNAAGTNVPSMIIGFARLWLFRIPFTWIGGFILGYAATGVWVGMALSNLLAMVVAIFFFSQGKWLRNLTSQS
jgi:Na+-driven multidrug efflux pump